MNERPSSRRPIIILGCPRSGTLLMARILGGHPEHFLVTEHNPKHRLCPEDRSGVVDHAIWATHFEFEGWDREKERQPPLHVPVYSAQSVHRVRNVYLALSAGKRLVVKNPTHVARVPILKEIFPDALFVFCIRHPWHTLQSMTAKGSDNKSFIVWTRKTRSLPNDILLQAAVSWEESVRAYLDHRNENWLAVRYEDLLTAPRPTIQVLLEFSDIDDEEYLEKVVKLPVVRDTNLFPVKRLFKASAAQGQIMEAIEEGSRCFSYDFSLESLNASPIQHYLRRIKQRTLRGSLLSRAGEKAGRSQHRGRFAPKPSSP